MTGFRQDQAGPGYRDKSPTCGVDRRQTRRSENGSWDSTFRRMKVRHARILRRARILTGPVGWHLCDGEKPFEPKSAASLAAEPAKIHASETSCAGVRQD